MLFLRTLYAYGFKSFATPTTLDFTSEMIGVVGPNGSGKSNITDAIRWALGEQSNKSLRGKSMDDIVFSGSVNKAALNNAKVSLTFSNERNTFSTLDADVVEITRTFDKKKRESEFFINGEKVKLREVQELALETGLTKSSLAIISQGTITNFASSRPEDRRELFNEAAGVAKYKKRKQEALNKLIHAQENLNRFNDLVSEISKRLPSLERAAKKAKIYQEKSKELAEIEIAIIQKDLQIFFARVEEINGLLSDTNQKISELTKEINGSDDEFKSLATQLNDYEQQNASLQNDINQLNQRLVDLRVKKTQADSRESQKNANVNDDVLQATRLKKEYQENKVRLETEEGRSQQLNADITKEREQNDLLTQQFDAIVKKIDQIRKNVNQLEARISYENNHQTTNRTAQDYIIQNKSRIGGVIGKLIDLVEVDNQYQEAISVVSAQNMFSVVMESSQATKNALEFLDINRLGRATFLPLDTLAPTTISGVNRNVIEQAPGFLGFANELVNIQSSYQKALDYALGSVIVVDDYDHALSLGRQINYRYNIVSLDGRRIMPKGAVQGGKGRNNNIFTRQTVNNLEELKKQVEELNQTEEVETKTLNEYRQARDKVRENINELEVSIRSCLATKRDLNSKLQSLNDDYRLITKTNIEGSVREESGESESLKIAREISKMQNQLVEKQQMVNQIIEARTKYAARQASLSDLNQEKRQELTQLKDSTAVWRVEEGKLSERIQGYTERLLDKYNLTPEAILAPDYVVVSIEDEDAVRSQIKQLTADLTGLGNVNLDSIQEYEQEKERFETFDRERKDVQSSVNNLNKIIQDMDESMVKQFKAVVDEVNAALPQSFAKLFGGGSAALVYTDPDDLLNTGIDIKVNPPGKKITNINLLSGGEKSLVALSVLFSILKVRPLPLVILDEAEAPLDPANVERFAKYIKNFTDDTQFIVVTHREGTMENCDVLYGVTMEQKGITKIVKIKLNQAKVLVDAEAGLERPEV